MRVERTRRLPVSRGGIFQGVTNVRAGSDINGNGVPAPRQLGGPVQRKSRVPLPRLTGRCTHRYHCCARMFQCRRSTLHIVRCEFTPMHPPRTHFHPFHLGAKKINKNPSPAPPVLSAGTHGTAFPSGYTSGL